MWRYRNVVVAKNSGALPDALGLVVDSEVFSMVGRCGRSGPLARSEEQP